MEFRESDHPRDDSGKFTSNGGGWSYPGINDTLSELKKKVENYNSRGSGQTRMLDSIHRRLRSLDVFVSDEMKRGEEGTEDVDMRALYSYRRRIRELRDKITKGKESGRW